MFLFLQLIGYMIAIGFSAGGGNYPEAVSGGFFIVKGTLLALPILGMFLHLLKRPHSSVKKFILLGKQNNWLMIYLIICLILLPFTVQWQYSLLRLCYTILEYISLGCLIIQYIQLNCIQTYKNHLFYLSITSLLLPFYVLVYQGTLTDFRTAIHQTMAIHPNILASFYGHLLLWNIFQFFNYKRLSILIVILGLIIIELLLFSRSVMISLLMIGFIMPFILYFIQRKTIYLITGLSFLFLALISFTVLCLDASLQENVLSLFLREDDLSSLATLTNRTVLWSILTENLSLKVLLTGWGYSVIAPEFGVDFGTGILYGAHNLYLSVLLGSGVFALLAILIYLWRNMVTVFQFKTFSTLTSILASYLLLLINGMASEEIGINLSLPFSYLILSTNIFRQET